MVLLVANDRLDGFPPSAVSERGLGWHLWNFINAAFRGKCMAEFSQPRAAVKQIERQLVGAPTELLPVETKRNGLALAGFQLDFSCDFDHGTLRSRCLQGCGERLVQRVEQCKLAFQNPVLRQGRRGLHLKELKLRKIFRHIEDIDRLPPEFDVEDIPCGDRPSERIAEEVHSFKFSRAVHPE